MADNVIIQNGAGEEIVYENVSGVELLNEDGETATFVHDAEILYENLPDKPFGNIPVVLEETELSFEADERWGGYISGFIATSEPIPGETYKVIWGETEYRCVCRSDKIHEGIADTEAVLYWFGNQTLFWNMGSGTDTGEPFVIWFGTNDAGEFCAIIETLETDAVHTVSIIPVNEVTKIDKKYLPDDVVGGSVPEFDLAAMGLPALPIDGTWVEAECDVTELCAALDKGVVKVKFTANLGVETEASGVISASYMGTAYQINYIGCMEATPMLLNFTILPLSSKIVGSILTLTAASSSTT